MLPAKLALDASSLVISPGLTLSNGGPVQPLNSTVGEERSDLGRIERIKPPNVTCGGKLTATTNGMRTCCIMKLATRFAVASMAVKAKLNKRVCREKDNRV